MHYFRHRFPAPLHHLVALGLWGLGLTRCAPAPLPQPVEAQVTHAQRQAAWVNGDFETDSIGTQPPSGWTATTYVGNGLSGATVAPPQSLAALNLSAGGTVQTTVVGGAVGTQIDPDLGSGQSFRFPMYGNRAARINYHSASANGDNRNANALQQRMNLNANDIDPADNQVHVRFVVAPVLENPSHPFSQQPFYYIELLNLSRGTTLYRNFNIAGQSGVPWNTATSLMTKNTTQWVNWQLVDIAPGNDALMPGDQVQLTAVAGGCSLGGHFGRLYVDGLGTSVPGLYATAHGPQTASPSQTITYSVAFANGGTASTAGTYVEMLTPPQTTFQGVSLPGCTTPVVGATGVVSCPLGVLAAGAAGQFTVDVTLAAGAAGSITNGTYTIGAINSAPLLGMPTTLQVQPTAVTYADISVVASTQATAAAPGSPVRLSYTVTNTGPADLGVASIGVVGNITQGLVNPTWTCALSAGDPNTSRCGIAAGNGNIIARPILAAGAAVTYVLQAKIDANTAAALLVQNLAAHVVTVSVDPDTTNNTASTQIAVGTPHSLSVTKSGTPAAGTLSAVPAAIQCDPNCQTTQGSFAEGTLVRLVAIPVANAMFTGWSGGCTGSQPFCQLSMSADAAVTANFAPTPAAEAASAVAAYDGAGQYARVGTSFAQALTAVVVDGAGTPVPGVNVNFAAPNTAASAALSPNVSLTDAFGLARTQVTANANQGSYTVTAAVSGVVQAANFTLYNVGAAKTLSYVVGTGQSAAAGSLFSSVLTARILDNAGNPVPQAMVTFSAPASGATAHLSATSVLTDPLGYATLAATANATTGNYSVTAATAGVASPLAFAMTNATATASAVYGVSGTPQITQAQVGFIQPLTVVVTNATGDPLPNVTVAFKAPTTGASASLSAATAVTNSLGQASVTATANATPGSYLVTGAVGSASPKASFALTNNGSRYLLAQTGDQQTASVGQDFVTPIVVQLSDSTATPVANAVVTFASPNTGPSGIVQTPSATTDAQGNANTTVRAGTQAGSYQVTATAASVAVPVSFGLTNNASAAAALQIVSGNNQSQSVQQTYPQAIVLRVVDNQNNPIPGASVTFTEPVDLTGGSVSQATVTADATGLVSVSAAAGKLSGTYALIASVGEGGQIQQSLHLTTTAGPATQWVKISGDNQQTVVRNRFAQPLVVRAIDALGNPVEGVVVQPLAAPVGPGATFAQTPLASDANGFVSVSLSASATAGSYTVTLAASDGAGNATFSLTNTAAVAAYLSLVAGDNQNTTVAQSFMTPLRVQVADAYGNAAAGAQVHLTSAAQGASLDLTSALATVTATSDSSGMAAFTVSANAIAGVYTAQITLLNTASTATFYLTNTPGPAAGLVVVSGTPQQASALATFAQPLQVRVNDAYGNRVPAAEVTYSAPESSPSVSLSSLSCLTDAQGVCSATATAQGAAGIWIVTATLAVDPPVASTANFKLTVVAGAAGQLSIVTEQGQSAVVDSLFAAPLVAWVGDAGHNPVGNIPVTFAAPSAGASLSTTYLSALTDATGLATVSGRAGHTAGDYNVTVSFAGLLTPQLVQMHNLAGPATSLSVLSGNKQSNAVLAALGAPLVVQVTDLYGNVVQGANVVLGAPTDGPGAVFDALVGVSDANGQVSFTGTTSAVAGSYQVVASLEDSSAVTSFSLQNLAGAPVGIAVVSGDGQQMAVDSALSAPLIAVVTDAQSNPVPHVVVTFAAPVTGPSLNTDLPSYTTNGRGLVGAQGVANTVTGAYTVAAFLPDLITAATFSVTNVSGGVANVTVVSGDGQDVVVDAPFGEALTVAVTDAMGNAVQGAHVGFQMHTPSAGLSLNTTSVQTNSAGCVSVQATALRLPGPAAIDAVLDDGTTVTLTATLVPGPAVSLVADPQATVQAATVATPFVAPLGATAYDLFGNAVPGVWLTFAAPAGPASAALATLAAVTDTSGHASVQATANTVAGIYTVAAGLTGVTGPQASYLLHNLAGPPHDLQVVTQARSQTQVQTAFGSPLSVVLRDLHGNAVPRVPVQFQAPQAGATASLDNITVLTDETGLAQVNAVAGPQAGTYTVVASYISGQQPALFTLTNIPGPLAVLTLDAQASLQAASLGSEFAQALRLTASDTWGNFIPGIAISYAQPQAGAHAILSETTAVTDATGSAQIYATANRTPGSYTVRAAADAAAAPLQATFRLTNTAGAVATLTSITDVAQDTEVTTPFLEPLQVVVSDSLGSPIADVNVAFQAPTTGASAQLSSSVITTDDNGVATTLALANTLAGHYTVLASYAEASAPFIFTLHNTQGPATSLTLGANATPQAAVEKQSFAVPLSVVLRDAYGNPEPNQIVTFAVPFAEPTVTLSSYTAVTDASGYAAVSAVAGTQTGNYTVTVTAASTAQSANFVLHSTELPPPIIAVAQGGQQTILATHGFGTPVAFVLRTNDGDVVANAEVTLTSMPAGLVLGGGPYKTDSNGYVSVTVAAGRVTGAFSLIATTAAAQTPATAQLNVAPIETTLALSATDAALALGAKTLLHVTAAAAQAGVTGHVTFLVDGQSIGTQILDAAGQATQVTPVLGVGTHQVVAQLDADDPFAFSISPTLPLTVDAYVMSGGGSCAQASGGGPAQSVLACCIIAAVWAGMRRARRRHL